MTTERETHVHVYIQDRTECFKIRIYDLPYSFIITICHHSLHRINDNQKIFGNAVKVWDVTNEMKRLKTKGLTMKQIIKTGKNVFLLTLVG